MFVVFDLDLVFESKRALDGALAAWLLAELRLEPANR
jgi:hypothetical protein